MAKTSGLIKIKKDGEVLEINPKTWPQHKALGWQLVNPSDVEEEAEPAEAEVKPASARTRTPKGKAGKAVPPVSESDEG